MFVVSAAPIGSFARLFRFHRRFKFPKLCGEMCVWGGIDLQYTSVRSAQYFSTDHSVTRRYTAQNDKTREEHDAEPTFTPINLHIRFTVISFELVRVKERVILIRPAGPPRPPSPPHYRSPSARSIDNRERRPPLITSICQSLIKVIRGDGTELV